MNCIKVYWKVRKRIPTPQIQWTTSPPSSMDKLVMHALDSFNRTLSHSVAFPANFWPSSLSSHPFLLVLGNPLFRPWWLLGPLPGRGPSQATAPDRLHPWSMVYGSLPSKMGDTAYSNKSTGTHDGFGYTILYNGIDGWLSNYVQFLKHFPNPRRSPRPTTWRVSGRSSIFLCMTHLHFVQLKRWIVTHE